VCFFIPFPLAFPLLPRYHINMLKKRMLFFCLLLIAYYLLPNTAYAVCPVCTIAVGAGLGISRALGIDDAVTSVWIGGLILSMSFWLIDWIGKKRKSSLSPIYQLLATISMFLLTLLPLYFGKYIDRPYNEIFGVDKILFGTFWGSLAFMLGMWADKKVRSIKGRQLFIYQKVIFPVSVLLITSIILHFIVGSW
jgi:hypothetical protein